MITITQMYSIIIDILTFLLNISVKIKLWVHRIHFRPRNQPQHRYSKYISLQSICYNNAVKTSIKYWSYLNIFILLLLECKMFTQHNEYAEGLSFNPVLAKPYEDKRDLIVNQILCFVDQYNNYKVGELNEHVRPLHHFISLLQYF